MVPGGGRQPVLWLLSAQTVSSQTALITLNLFFSPISVRTTLNLGFALQQQRQRQHGPRQQQQRKRRTFLHSLDQFDNLHYGTILIRRWIDSSLDRAMTQYSCYCDGNPGRQK